MTLKRLALLTAFLFLGLGLATTAQAKKFSLTGGGGQLHIGNGLALPIQAAVPACTLTPPAAIGACTGFPTLVIPAVVGHTVMGTTTKTALLANGAYQQALTVGPGALSKPAAQTTVGVKFSNPSAFAVATNLKYTWPAAKAFFNTTARTGPKTGVVQAKHGGTVTYSNPLAAKFGGPAQFKLSGGAPAGSFAAPVTVFIKIGAGTPPCTHTALGGVAGTASAACVAGALLAVPTGLAAPGGPAGGASVTTPGAVAGPLNVALMKMGAVPLGTVLPPAPVFAATAPLPTNAAVSAPAPWTTGRVVIKNTAAAPPETFTLTGMDSRSVGGLGTIQMVSGSVSTRLATGPNSNRGWVRLVLGPHTTATPAMSPAMLALGAGMMVLAAGYVVRRSASA